MNTSALKAFAPAVRRQLMEAVERKLDVVLAAESPDYRTTYARQVAALGRKAASDRQGLVERVAYTWFNRLAALRYLDARGWHPFRAHVLMPATPEETQPEVLKLLRNGALPAELAAHVDAARLDDLLDGRIPSPNPQGEVYRRLVLGACRYYHALLPDLFERLDDETELLLPDDLLTETSVAQGFRTEITDEDCAEVEVLGWLYQFYISEKKDAVMARKSAVPSEDIPAVTQLFTPHWIVRYLVENSLGRLWLLNRPGSALREQMPYYIEGEAETDFLTIATPQEIRLIDPAVGSGHMLTYAFDLLYAIYEEEGYAPSEIPGLILTHNLYGVDIDPRAAQLASLALVLKAREKARRFFAPDVLVQPHVIALQDVAFSEQELREYVRALDLGRLFDAPVLELLGQFEHATTFGSLIQPVLGEKDIQQLRERIVAKGVGSELFLSETHAKVLRLLEQAEYLTQRYHVVAANPPYMGGRQMNPLLKAFLQQAWPAGGADTYAAFMLRNISLNAEGGLVGMITIPNWMFTSTYEDLRLTILNISNISTMVHCGRGVWGGDFGSCAFVIESKSRPKSTGVFKRLFKRQGEIQSNEKLTLNFFNDNDYPNYSASVGDFRKIPGAPISYWTPSKVTDIFSIEPQISTEVEARQGLATGDNEIFARLWHEVESENIRLNCTSCDDSCSTSHKWFPYNKGGPFRKWFGNIVYVVNWKSDGSEIRDFRDTSDKLRSRPQNTDFYFREGVTWSDVTSGSLSCRYLPSGCIYDVSGHSAFPKSDTEILCILAYMNTIFSSNMVQILNPTLHFQIGDFNRLPYPARHINMDVANIAREALRIARGDWQDFETSWDFNDLPLLSPEHRGTTLTVSWSSWKNHCDAAIAQMQALETENNRLFIEAYGLQGELSPEVPENQITLARADRRKDVAAFLSYAVGCMMGRYSLDTPGLVLANAGDTLQHYLEKIGKPLDDLTFTPDADGILPVLDGEWFEDDLVSRTRDFLRATFGEASLRENLRFIEESLGKDLRKYFLTDFYKDHLQTYKKRPIYWMVQSPRKGFSVLVYLHRYTRDTMNLVLNRYLRDYQVKLRNRLSHLARALADGSLSARELTAARKESDKLTKTLHECEAWERDTLLPLAQARIELDLDDGVKVNYLKLQEALAPIPGLAKAEAD